MPTITKTVTINVCDRCGSEHKASDYTKGHEWGQLRLKWAGDKGGRTWQGDAGGIDLVGEAWLCAPCTDAFLVFMQPTKAAESAPPETKT